MLAVGRSRSQLLEAACSSYRPPADYHMGFLNMPVHFIQPTRQESNHTCHILLVRSKCQVLPTLKRGEVGIIIEAPFNRTLILCSQAGFLCSLPSFRSSFDGLLELVENQSTAEKRELLLTRLCRFTLLDLPVQPNQP